MARIIDIEGIGPKYATKLQELGIRSTERLLALAANKRGVRTSPKKPGFLRN